jgi:hypothetical protein
MIRQTAQGDVLYSKDGSRRLGGPYRTREKAVKREGQVQFSKHARKRARWRGARPRAGESEPC